MKEISDLAACGEKPRRFLRPCVDGFIHFRSMRTRATISSMMKVLASLPAGPRIRAIPFETRICSRAMPGPFLILESLAELSEIPPGATHRMGNAGLLAHAQQYTPSGEYPEGSSQAKNVIILFEMDLPNLVPFDSLVGRLLRLPLRLIPNGTCIPVLFGPNRGHRFIKGAGTNGYWLGTAERTHQALAVKHIRPGQIVYDIGANVGLHTLLFSRLVGDEGQVFAFEPSPDTAALLAEHVRINRRKNVTIIQKAIAGRAGEMRFSGSGDSRIRRLDVGGETTVLSVTLDQVTRDLPPPACIKMDIEGAEAEALLAAAECFQRYRPKLFLATHGSDVPCCALLRSWDYDIEFFAGPDLLALPK